MARLTYSKAALHKEAARLKRYRQFLPSLELKRKQLLAESHKAAARVRQTERQIDALCGLVAEQLPMLADERIDLSGLVSVTAVVTGNENIAGVLVPVLVDVDIAVKPYPFYAQPHWVDVAADVLRQMLELKLALRVNQRRLHVLRAAVKKVTQRINFFEKMLIPRAQDAIRRIGVFLADSERAAVVRAKITKQKRACAATPWR